MDHQLKNISKSGIAEAIAKVELYRYLNAVSYTHLRAHET